MFTSHVLVFLSRCNLIVFVLIERDSSSTCFVLLVNETILVNKKVSANPVAAAGVNSTIFWARLQVRRASSVPVKDGLLGECRLFVLLIFQMPTLRPAGPEFLSSSNSHKIRLYCDTNFQKPIGPFKTILNIKKNCTWVVEYYNFIYLKNFLHKTEQDFNIRKKMGKKLDIDLKNNSTFEKLLFRLHPLINNNSFFLLFFYLSLRHPTVIRSRQKLSTRFPDSAFLFSLTFPPFFFQ